MISCAWSSWDFGQTGTGLAWPKRYEGQACKRPMEIGDSGTRHHYMSRVIEELGLNTVMMETCLLYDFYPELKRPPLRSTT